MNTLDHQLKLIDANQRLLEELMSNKGIPTAQKIESLRVLIVNAQAFK